MKSRQCLIPTLALTAAMVGFGNLAFAQHDNRPYSPDLIQLRETVADRLAELTDKLALTPDQRTKIKAVDSDFAEQYKTLRADRHTLLENEFKAISEILTPPQRDKVHAWVEEKREKIQEAVAKHEWPHVQCAHETLGERIRAAADRLGLTSGQRTQIHETHTTFMDRYRSLHIEVRSLVDSEFRRLEEILTPEQRDKARHYIIGRFAHAPAVQSIADRLHTAADKLGLTAEQRDKIRETHKGFASRYHTLREDRRELMHAELQAISSVFTPEQKEKIENMLEDRVVVVGVDFDPNNPESIVELRETIPQRLDAIADKLGLSAEERAKIKEIHAGYSEKYKVQRERRRNLREEEMKAMSAVLTPEQRERVKNYIEDKIETAQNP